MTTSLSSEALSNYKKVYGKQKIKKKIAKEIRKSQNFSTTKKYIYIYVFCSLTDRHTDKIVIDRCSFIRSIFTKSIRPLS